MNQFNRGQMSLHTLSCALLALALGAAMPAAAHEFNHGGPLCNPAVPYSACYEIAAQHGAQKRLDGWYVSAGTTWLGYPGSCVVAGSDTRFLFHAMTYPTAPGSSPWAGIVHDEPAYRAMMTRSKWGAHIYNVVRSRGWLETPELHEMSGDEAVALGAPRC